jgi:hypothetical protein
MFGLHPHIMSQSQDQYVTAIFFITDAYFFLHECHS